MATYGLILCGGKSSRMGSDKGLLSDGEQTWAERQFKKLAPLVDDCKVSVNQNQLDAYSKLFGASQLVVDEGYPNINGSLRGILSFRKKYPKVDVVVLACDYPLIRQETLQELAEQSKSTTLKDSTFQHPLIAYYSKDSLFILSKMAEEGELENRSVRSVLSVLNFSAITPQDQNQLRNINTKEELLTIRN